jgi:hypothetical protein
MSGKSILLFAAFVVFLFLLLHIINRWLNPWLAKRSVEKILRGIKEGKSQKPRNYDYEILFDSNNISVRSLKNKPVELTPIAWTKILKATAFKRDLFTVDCICLLLETSDKKHLELNEDMKGWLEFTDTMPKHLQGCKPLQDWIFEVAHPAFAPNPTEIFCKKAIP